MTQRLHHDCAVVPPGKAQQGGAEKVSIDLEMK
jgi:hypothetical protein